MPIACDADGCIFPPGPPWVERPSPLPLPPRCCDCCAFCCCRPGCPDSASHSRRTFCCSFFLLELQPIFARCSKQSQKHTQKLQNNCGLSTNQIKPLPDPPPQPPLTSIFGHCHNDKPNQTNNKISVPVETPNRTKITHSNHSNQSTSQTVRLSTAWFLLRCYVMCVLLVGKGVADTPPKSAMLAS